MGPIAVWSSTPIHISQDSSGDQSFQNTPRTLKADTARLRRDGPCYTKHANTEGWSRYLASWLLGLFSAFCPFYYKLRDLHLLGIGKRSGKVIIINWMTFFSSMMYSTGQTRNIGRGA